MSTSFSDGALPIAMARYEPHDKFYRRAREQGLPSRAAFKLEELINRFRLVRRGARALDLGCAPGGWLAILANAIGESGRVVGVDLATCARCAPNVVTLEGDILYPAIHAAALAALEGPADLVTSDLAPKLTGIAEQDQARAAALIAAALTIAGEVLRPGGAMVAKVFMGSEFEVTRGRFGREFAKNEIVRTKASRPGSAELYLVGRNFRGAGQSG
jgi:23S rRNA (uridine2552-2'-O)-methyltransferase